MDIREEVKDKLIINARTTQDMELYLKVCLVAIVSKKIYKSKNDNLTFFLENFDDNFKHEFNQQLIKPVKVSLKNSNKSIRFTQFYLKLFEDKPIPKNSDFEDELDRLKNEKNKLNKKYEELNEDFKIVLEKSENCMFLLIYKSK